MFSLATQAVYRFFTVMLTSLNKGEKDQPPPLEVQRQHLEAELKQVNDKIAKGQINEAEDARRL